VRRRRRKKRKSHARSARRRKPSIPASANVKVRKVDELLSEDVPLEVEFEVEEGGTAVPGETVLVKKPMSEVEVSAVVLGGRKVVRLM
jgi:hypothetical protein